MILERIAKEMKKSGKSRYQISKDTGIDQAVLSRIANLSRIENKGSCNIRTADILCKYLGLELVEKSRVQEVR